MYGKLFVLPMSDYYKYSRVLSTQINFKEENISKYIN